MKRVFISYSSDDRAAVAALVQHLEAAGLDVWFDQEISGGQAWWSTILEHLRACEVMVAMVTDASVASAACRSEVAYARALGKTVIPVRLGPLGPDDAPSALQELQWIDYREPTVEIALALVRAAYHAPAAALPDPLPPAPPAPLSYQAQIVDRVYGAEPLNVDQQLAIVYTLRQWIASGGDPAQVLQLATRFRERDDLLASVVADAEAVVGEARAATASVPASASAPTTERATTERAVATGAGAPVPIEHDPRPGPRERAVGSRRPGRAFLIVSLAAAAVVLFAIVGSFRGDDDEAAADTTEPTIDTLDTAFAETVPDGGEQFDLGVPGTEASTDSGYYLYAGDVVTIEATGSIVHDTSTGGSADPIGDPNPDLAQFNVIADAAHGALLYRIGDGAAWLPVGWFLEFTVEQEGQLYLGPNDAGVDNNDGTFLVAVTVTRAG